MAPNLPGNATTGLRPTGSWLRLEANTPQSPKVATLPSDAARWAYAATLCAAKKQVPGGCWVSERHYAECVTASVRRHLPELIGAGLVEIVPDLCPECLRQWPEITPGVLVVHDWRRYQIDPTGAERKQRERGRRDTEAVAPVTSRSRDGHGAVTVQSRQDGERDTDEDVDLDVLSERTTHGSAATSDESLNTVVTWLAHNAQGAELRSGNRLLADLRALVDKHGPTVVVSAMEAVRVPGGTSNAQFVYGADRKLNPIPSPRPPRPTGLPARQGSYDEEVVAR